MTAARRERAALVETLRSVGPDALTLCAGWTTRDLAAHLVLRERRAVAATGIMVPALAGYTARVQKRLAATTDWEDLVDMVASGPPLFSLHKVLDPLVNTGEMFIHHEDVRRARDDWQPRALDDGILAALRRMVSLTTRMNLSGAPARVTLRDSSGATVATVGRGPEVLATGALPELLLFISGRDAVRVEFQGDPATIDDVRAARRKR